MLVFGKGLSGAVQKLRDSITHRKGRTLSYSIRARLSPNIKRICLNGTFIVESKNYRKRWKGRNDDNFSARSKEGREIKSSTHLNEGVSFIRFG